MNLRPPGYEPGELPGCSTPRRCGKDTIRLVPWWTLAALVFLGCVLLSATIVGLLWFRRLRALQRLGEGLTTSLETLATKAEALEGRMDETQERVEDAERRVEVLRHSLERFSVLTWALGDTRRSLARLRTAGRK